MIHLSSGRTKAASAEFKVICHRYALPLGSDRPLIPTSEPTAKIQILGKMETSLTNPQK